MGSDHRVALSVRLPLVETLWRLSMLTLVDDPVDGPSWSDNRWLCWSINPTGPIGAHVPCDHCLVSYLVCFASGGWVGQPGGPRHCSGFAPTQLSATFYIRTIGPSLSASCGRFFFRLLYFSPERSISPWWRHFSETSGDVISWFRSKTLQELRMLSSVTLYCQVPMIVVFWCS